MNQHNDYTIGKGVTVFTASRFFSLLASMLSAMLLSRLITLREYGTYSAIMTVTNLSVAIFTLGLPSSISYFCVQLKSRKSRDDFLGTYLISIIFSGLWAGVFLFMLRGNLASYYRNDALKSLGFILCFLPLCRSVSTGRNNFLVAFNKTNRLGVYTFAESLFLLLLVSLVWLLGLSFRAYLILFLIVEFVFAFLIIVEIVGTISTRKPRLNRELLSEVLRFSLPIGLATMVGTISLELDKLMIGYWFNAEELAIYTKAAKELPISIFSQALITLLLPVITSLFSKGQKEQGVRLWGVSISLSFSIISFLVAAMIVFAPQIMTILYSEKYITGVSVFRIYSLAMIWRTTYFGMALNATGKTNSILINAVISLIMNFILNIILYYSIGFVGPAIATFLSLAIASGIQLGITAKHINCSVKILLPWKELGKIFLVNLFTGIIVFFLTRLIKIDITPKGILYAVGLGVVWLILYVLLNASFFKGKWQELNNQGETI